MVIVGSEISKGVCLLEIFSPSAVSVEDLREGLEAPDGVGDGIYSSR